MRDLAKLVQYQSEALFKTLSCSIHVHSVLVDQPLSMFVMLYSYCSVSQTTEHGGPIDGRHETYVTSKYHSVNVLVSRPSLCVLLKKYMTSVKHYMKFHISTASCIFVLTLSQFTPYV